jgi:hypothetical protein
MRSMPLLPLFEATVTDGSFTASTGLFTTTVVVAVSQFAGLTFNLLMDWLRILVGDAVRPLWYWLQRLLFRWHQCSMVLSLMALHWYWCSRCDVA